MAEHDDKSLIGFDPLAWLSTDENDESTSENDIVPVADQDDASPESVTSPELTDDENDDGIEHDLEAPVSDETSPVLLLDSVLGIQNVMELQQKLRALLSSDKNIIDIDASGVTHVDTASLQLLIVFKKAVVNQGKELNIDFPSENFIESCELLGISEILGLNQASGFF